MDRRLILQNDLVDLLGSNNVYYQPPANFKMQYPAIVYRRDHIDVRFANNMPYSNEKRYIITVIDPDPDSVIPEEVANLPKCRHDRRFQTSNLYHDVFELYF